jgi:hypothetical protein
VICAGLFRPGGYPVEAPHLVLRGQSMQVDMGFTWTENAGLVEVAPRNPMSYSRRSPRETGLNPDARKMVRVESGGGGVCWIKAQWIKSSPGDCVRRS